MEVKQRHHVQRHVRRLERQRPPDRFRRGAQVALRQRNQLGPPGGSRRVQQQARPGTPRSAAGGYWRRCGGGDLVVLSTAAGAEGSGQPPPRGRSSKRPATAASGSSSSTGTPSASAASAAAAPDGSPPCTTSASAGRSRSINRSSATVPAGFIGATAHCGCSARKAVAASGPFGSAQATRVVREMLQVAGAGVPRKAASSACVIGRRPSVPVMAAASLAASIRSNTLLHVESMQ